MTFTTPSKHDPDGVDIDNNFEEQEKWEQTYYLDGNVFIKMTNGMWKVIDGNDGLVKTISPRPERNSMSDTREKIEKIISKSPSTMSEDYNLIHDLAKDILSIVREAVSAVKPKDAWFVNMETMTEVNKAVRVYHDALMEVLS